MALSMAFAMIGSQSSSAVNRLLTWPALLYIGTISYSLYLFHFIAPGLALPGPFETDPAERPKISVQRLAARPWQIGSFVFDRAWCARVARCFNLRRA